MKFYSIINKGYKGECISIQCILRPGFPSFDITGLADSSINEAKERVKSSIRASGFHFPKETILINLAPSYLEKHGPTLDLAIALSIIFAKETRGLKIFALGELDLNGNIIKTPGKENITEAAINNNADIIILPPSTELKRENLGSIKVIQESTLSEAFDALIEHINALNPDEDEEDTNEPLTISSKEEEPPYIPFDGIIGLEVEKEALIVAAAGGHSLLFFGARGVGKSMLISHFPKLIPALDPKTREELSRIRASFNLDEEEKGQAIYFDEHNASRLLTSVKNTPPEVTLSHGGAVLIDEITSVADRSLTILRNAHDKGEIKVNKKDSYPFRFSLIATMNPCPCGNLGSKKNACYCSPNRLTAHWRNINTPLLSRFDIVCPVDEADFLKDKVGDYSDVFERINTARNRQRERFKNSQFLRLNGDLAIFGNEGNYLKQAYMYFPNAENPRDALLYYSLALTLKDLDDKDNIEPIHIEKALLLKTKDPFNHYDH